MNVHSTREQIICRSMREHIGLHIVTAGATVPAAFAGVHRNHHFDTIRRLHPLLHPLHPGIGLDYSSIYRKLQSSLFFHEKRDINAPRVNISFSYYNSLVKHQIDKLEVSSALLIPTFFQIFDFSTICFNHLTPSSLCSHFI